MIVTVGLTESFLMITELLALPAELVAEHMYVVPVVSGTATVPQPLFVGAGLPVTIHLSVVVLLVYQPLVLSVPVTSGVTVGGQRVASALAPNLSLYPGLLASQVGSMVSDTQEI